MAGGPVRGFGRGRTVVGLVRLALAEQIERGCRGIRRGRFEHRVGSRALEREGMEG